MREQSGENGLPRTWPDGTVRLPEAIEEWLDGHFDGEKGDDADELVAGRNVVAVALWSLMYRQGDPESDQEALAALSGAVPPLVAANVSFCVTHGATDHDDGRAWAACRFRQLFYFENPMDEHTLAWSDNGGPHV